MTVRAKPGVRGAIFLMRALIRSIDRPVWRIAGGPSSVSRMLKPKNQGGHSRGEPLFCSCTFSRNRCSMNVLIDAEARSLARTLCRWMMQSIALRTE